MATSKPLLPWLETMATCRLASRRSMEVTEVVWGRATLELAIWELATWELVTCRAALCGRSTALNEGVARPSEGEASHGRCCCEAAVAKGTWRR